MGQNIEGLTSREVSLLTDIFEKLSAGADADSLRRGIGDDLLRLFKSDVFRRRS